MVYKKPTFNSLSTEKISFANAGSCRTYCNSGYCAGSYCAGYSW